MLTSSRCIVGLAVLSVLSLSFLSPASPARDAGPEISAHARAILARAIVVDTHDDTPQRMLWENFDLAHRDKEGNIDIPRMREGDLNAIFMSIWTPGTIPATDAVSRALRMIDMVREQVKKHPQDLLLATSVADVRRARKENKIAVLMGMEGGHMINDDLGLLRRYASLGVRYLTLTHSVNDDWADSSTDKPAHNGLTPFGRKVVTELNRLGVLVDISHVSDKTFYDAIEVSRAPVIASHSSCRALCNAPRNMNDDMLRALAKNGGVVQINFHIGFLSQQYADASKNPPQEYKDAMAAMEKQCGEDEACKVLGYQHLSDEATARGLLPPVPWQRIVDHIDHAVKVAGIDHVGLGSDFDGAIMPRGMEDVSHYPLITEELIRRGYSDDDIVKILGGNLLRVLGEAERVSSEMRRSTRR
ncbi:MAG TPA: dipeptidase [Candidatus Acidoferrales bacterium]|nr:dipeptidase [Candidatus Acidoferrales bacterium]